MEVLIRVETIWVVLQLVIIAIAILAILVIVVHVVHWVQLFNWVLLVILFHHLQVDLVVHLESLQLDLLSPSVVMDLNIVQNGVHEYSDVWVLIRQQLKHD